MLSVVAQVDKYVERTLPSASSGTRPHAAPSQTAVNAHPAGLRWQRASHHFAVVSGSHVMKFTGYGWFMAKEKGRCSCEGCPWQGLRPRGLHEVNTAVLCLFVCFGSNCGLIKI